MKRFRAGLFWTGMLLLWLGMGVGGCFAHIKDVEARELLKKDIADGLQAWNGLQELQSQL